MEAESATTGGVAAAPLQGGAVLYRPAQGVAHITLNRPEVLNAINGAMHHGLLEALEKAADDDDIRVAVSRGSGRAFSAGGDLTVAAAGARFGEVQINHGERPPLAIAPFAVGLKQAKEILLLGEMFDAELARQLGLINRVVDDDKLDAEVASITERITTLKAETVAANKLLINSRYEAAGVTGILSYQEA